MHSEELERELEKLNSMVRKATESGAPVLSDSMILEQSRKVDALLNKAETQMSAGTDAQKA